MILAPRYRLQADIDSGALVEVMQRHPPTPTPLSALYPHNRQFSLRLRVFLNRVAVVFAEASL